ncbi:MAG: hypothetical protein J3K34DRAFT_476103 [Monoraphidium minutum]|nr:MAG: hypothetical protein J3K34DRAFT_476103 [Monoraphidium minutum]
MAAAAATAAAAALPPAPAGAGGGGRVYRNAHVVLAGDFNCITDSMDSSSPNAAQQAATRGAQALRELTAHFSFADAWQHHRARRPGASGEVYTHWATCGGTARRLDRVYVSSPLVAAGQLLACWHRQPGDLPGDHSCVTTELAAIGSPPAAPPRWRLPLDLLGDGAYLDDIREEIECMQRGSVRAAGGG